MNLYIEQTTCKIVGSRCWTDMFCIRDGWETAYFHPENHGIGKRGIGGGWSVFQFSVVDFEMIVRFQNVHRNLTSGPLEASQSSWHISSPEQSTKKPFSAMRLESFSDRAFVVLSRIGIAMRALDPSSS
jgi:hypothetical protein